ncbi:MAG: acyl-CoA dehydrogenase family protein [Acidimicrobiales bacterium]
MDLRYSAEEEELRRSLRAWLAGVLPGLPQKPRPDDWDARRRYDMGWQRLLYEAGYGGVDWPKDAGGRGSSPVEQLVFLEELQRARAPGVGVGFVGLLHAGPTIIAEGSAAQRARYLQPILAGEEVWCQGFSEPDAGSDLAALKTRAVRDGDDYVVSGQKIWTSHAQVADLCELLVRTGTEGSRHRGITWLVMPMDAPGVEVRPLRTIAGSSEFSELFLDEVRIPVANRVGAENDGWRVAMVTFAFERGTAFVAELLESMELMRLLAASAKESGFWDDPCLRQRLGSLAAELDALWALTRRNVSEASRSGVPGIGGSVFKLAFSELRQSMADLWMDIEGRSALVWGEPADMWVNSLSRTIAAGTSQVQRNILAERVLGLPKEPSTRTLEG